MSKIAIFDYGAGNLFSLKSALERNGAENVEIIYDLKEVERFDGLVLPGVGNFDPAIKSIEGSAQHLRCPYHGWTYTLEGALFGTPQFAGVCDFEPAQNGLVPIAVATWEDWVFVRLAAALFATATVIVRFG